MGAVQQVMLAQKIAAGYTQQQTQGNENDSNGINTVHTINKALAGSFTASSSYTLTKADVILKKTGTPSGDVTAELWSDSSGSPGTKLADSTTTQATSGISSAASATYSFLFTGSSLTSSTKYWIALRGSWTADNTNYVIWYGNPSGTQAHYGQNGDTLAWGSIQTSMDATLTLYSG